MLITQGPKAWCLPTATLESDNLNPEIVLKEGKEGAALFTTPTLTWGWNTDDCLYYFLVLPELSEMTEMFYVCSIQYGSH